MGNLNLNSAAFYDLEKAGEIIKQILNKAESSEVFTSTEKENLNKNLPALIEEKFQEAKKHTDEILSLNNAMVFRGLFEYEGNNLYNEIYYNKWSAGWTWKQTYSDTIRGNALVDGVSTRVELLRLEDGDMIVALKDHPETVLDINNATLSVDELKNLINEYFGVIPANTDGSVTSVESESEDGEIPVFSGTNGRVIKKSGAKIGDVSDAVNKKHEHKNKSEIDKITEGDVERWNNKADLENGKLKSEQLPHTTVTRTGSYFGAAGNIPVVSGASAVTDSGVNIADLATKKGVEDAVKQKENTANKGIAGGYASLGDDGKVPTSQLPDNIGGGSDLSITIPSDIHYEIVEGKKINYYGKVLLDDENCFTIYIKIPEKKFAYIYATVRNAIHTINERDYNASTVICDADKNILSANVANNGTMYSIFASAKTAGVEGATYFALSYTNGTEFEVKIAGVDVVNENYLPISTTDLPKDFIVKGDNLITGLTNIYWLVNSNQWREDAVTCYTNFFEITNGEAFHHNGKFLNVYFFDEDYGYIGVQRNYASGTAISTEDTVKYAYVNINETHNVLSDIWFSRKNLTRSKNKPTRIVNPEYVDLDNVERKQIKSWYSGKRITFLGDSLTGNGSGGQYLTYLDNFFGFASMTNCGIGGTFVSGETVTAGDPFWHDSRVNAVDIDSDIIVIMGGTNDAGNNVPIGEANISNNDTSTFIGAYNVLISKLLYKFFKLDSGYYADIDYSGVTQVEEVKPIKIFLATPPYRLNNAEVIHKFIPYADAVIDVGRLSGYPVCNIQANSGVNVMLASYYNKNGDYVHLNEEAHKNWASVIIGRMLQIEPIE